MDTFLYEAECFGMMKKKALTDKFSFPYLVDGTQKVAKNFGATHTPQAYVISIEKSKWIIRYSGAIDDNAGHPEKAHSYIASAVDDLLRTSTVSRDKTESIGCQIIYRTDSSKITK